MEYVEVSGVASVLALGASMAVAASLIALSGSGRGAADWVLRYTAYVLLAVGVLGVCLIVGGWLGLVAWPITMVVWGRAVANYRATQRRNLFSALAVAIGHQMPLAPMALAFANEQERGFATRARDLAQKLDQGVPVPEALGQSGRALPPESALAAAVGLESGDLVGALNATASGASFDRSWLQPTISRLLYLAVVTVVFLTILTFFQIKIVPSFVKIFEDFGIELPDLTIATLPEPPIVESWLDWLTFQLPPGVGTTVLASRWLTASVAYAIPLVGVFGLYAWLQWRGTLYPRMPGLRRIITWIDMGPVLRVLALAARHNRPLTPMLVAISRLHPKRSVRGRVRRVVRDLDNGMPWCDSLRRHRLINATDAAALAAAQHTGNLSWALGEMAGGFERKATYRLQALAQTIVPLLLLPLGAAAAIIAIACFMPLAELVKSLA
jgi:type II secretory pathway component PulF